MATSKLAQGQAGGAEESAATGGARRIATPAHSASDLATAKDRLGFEPYVRAVVDFLISEDTHAPINLSIEGEWGAGKTSFMLQMQTELKEKHKVVNFNAWRHDSEESLWAAFALTFLKQLSDQMSAWRRLKAYGSLLDLRFDRRAGAIPLLKLIVGVVFWIVLIGGLIWFATSEQGAILIQSMGVEEPTIQPLVGFGGGAISLGVFLLTIIRHVNGTVGNPFRRNIRRYVRGVNYDERIGFIERFHEDFNKIVRSYAGGQKVFVFVDDLDRCAIPRAADLLQALNLLIDHENPLVLILGLDREKVAAGLAVKFEKVLPYITPFADKDGKADPARRRRAGLAFGYEFIEKFIQLPVHVPTASGERLDEFLDGLGHKPEKQRKKSLRERIGERIREWSSKGRLPIMSGLHKSPVEGPVEKKAAGETEKDDAADAEARWHRFYLRISPSVGDESSEVREIVRMVAPALDYNPRRIVHFINAFRLRAFTAFRTGLFNPLPNSDRPALELEQLGKFIAATVRWPLLRLHLQTDPDLLSRLARYATATAFNDRLERRKEAGEGG